MEFVKKFKLSPPEIHNIINKYFQTKDQIEKPYVFQEFLTSAELKKYLDDPNCQKVLVYLDRFLAGILLLLQDPTQATFYNPGFFQFYAMGQQKELLFIPRGGFLISAAIHENKELRSYFRSKILEVFKGRKLVVDYSPDVPGSYIIFDNLQKVCIDEMKGWGFKREECAVVLPIIKDVRVLDTFGPPLRLFEESWQVLKKGFADSYRSPCPHYFSKEEYAEIFNNHDFKKTFLFYKKECIGIAVVTEVEKVPFLNLTYLKHLYPKHPLFCIWDLTILPNHREPEIAILLLRSAIKLLPMESLIFFDHSQIINPSLPRAVKIALRLTDKPFGLQKLGRQRYEIVSL